MEEIIELSNILTRFTGVVMYCSYARETNNAYLLSLIDGFKDFSKIVNPEQLKNNFMEEIGKIHELGFDLFTRLERIYRLYGITTFDGCVERILEIWSNNHINNPELIKNTLLNLSDMYNSYPGTRSEIRKFATKSLEQLYVDMFYDGMLDPMASIGTSHEPLYALLPVDEKFFDINLQIIADRRIDWSIYSNGIHVLDRLCQDYESACANKNEKLAAYYHDAIMAAIRGSCSLFSNKFYTPGDFKPIIIRPPLYFRLFGQNKFYSHNLDEKLKEEIRDYLLTDEGFNNQCNNELGLYKDTSEQSDVEIAKIEELRAKRKEFI